MLRFRKILCPVDFFPASLKAYDYALKLASHYRARVHLLHVVTPVISAAYEGAVTVEDLMPNLQRESERRLQKLKAKAGKLKVSVDPEVCTGIIDEEILRVAVKERTDLIVMATHGRRGFQRFLLGSVTERMLRHSPVPLLVASSTTRMWGAPPKISRILVTTDFSAGTPDALTHAFSIARESAAKVTLLHAVPDLSHELGSELTRPMVASLREKLETLIPRDLRTSVRPKIEVGVPYRVIQKTIETEKPALVVMNIHGKAMLDRALLGSTAERVLRWASDKCPFLLIPPAKKRK